MTTTPYALLRVSANGGGPQTGGLLLAFDDVIQLSAESYVGWGSAGAPNAVARWEISSFPAGFALPSGWTEDVSTGAYYYLGNSAPPPFTLPSGPTGWGKWMLTLLVDGGLRNGRLDLSTLFDKSTAIRVLSPNGFDDIGKSEDTQFDAAKQWIAAYQANLRVLETVVDSVITATSAGTRLPVAVATTTNITLSGGQVIDGVVMLSGRVLVKDQTIPAQNGIYTVGTPWVRATDADTAAKIPPGSQVLVQGGTTNKNSVWVLATTGTINLGVTSLRFIRQSNSYDVRYFGAVADDAAVGAANVTAIDAAAAALPTGGGELVLGEGTMKLASALTFTKPVRLKLGRGGIDGTGSAAHLIQTSSQLVIEGANNVDTVLTNATGKSAVKLLPRGSNFVAGDDVVMMRNVRVQGGRILDTENILNSATITNCSNPTGTPILVTAATVGIVTGAKVTITSVGGQTLANGTWTATVNVPDVSFYIDQNGDGAHPYTEGGVITTGFFGGSITLEDVNGYNNTDKAIYLESQVFYFHANRLKMFEYSGVAVYCKDNGEPRFDNCVFESKRTSTSPSIELVGTAHFRLVAAEIIQRHPNPSPFILAYPSADNLDGLITIDNCKFSPEGKTTLMTAPDILVYKASSTQQTLNQIIVKNSEFYPPNPMACSQVTRASNIVTVRVNCTQPEGHGLIVGDKVAYGFNLSNSSFNGAYSIADDGAGSPKFVVTAIGSVLGSGPYTQTVSWRQTGADVGASSQDGFIANAGTCAIEFRNPVSNFVIADNIFAGYAYGLDDKSSIHGTIVGYDGGGVWRGNRGVGPLGGAFRDTKHGGRGCDRLEPKGTSGQRRLGHARVTEHISLVNRLAYSDTFTSWTGGAGAFGLTPTGGQTDPWGGTTASLLTRSGTTEIWSGNYPTQAFSEGLSINPDLTGIDFTSGPFVLFLSFWAKAGTTDIMTVTLHNGAVTGKFDLPPCVVALEKEWRRHVVHIVLNPDAGTRTLVIAPGTVERMAGTAYVCRFQLSDNDSDFVPTAGAAVFDTTAGSRFERTAIMGALTASYAVVTDASKRLASLVYSETAAVFSSIVKRTSAGYVRGVVFENEAGSTFVHGSTGFVGVGGVTSASYGLLATPTGISTNVVDEKTAAAGVTIDSLVLKDGRLDLAKWRTISPSLSKDAADATAGTTTAERTVPFRLPSAVTTLSAYFVPDAALTADNTDFATLKVWRRDSNGANQTAIASASTTVAGTNSWTALKPVSLGTITNAALAAGAVYTIEITKSGAGVIVPSGNWVIEASVD